MVRHWKIKKDMTILIVYFLPATNFSIVFFFSFLDIFHDAKECFLEVKYPLQRNISLDLPQRILLAEKKKDA